MAIIYRNKSTGIAMADILKRKNIPFEWQGESKNLYTLGQDSVKIVTMHSSKGSSYRWFACPELVLRLNMKVMRKKKRACCMRQ